MDYNILGIIVTILGILWTIFGIFSNRSIKKSILNEKDMIREKIIDFASRLQVYQKRILEDRKLEQDDTLNTVTIRIEDINSMVRDLNRFSEKLK